MASSFKKNLREVLDYNDMTIKELSYKTGISSRSIENYLNSRESMPPADYACKIAHVLNTSVEFLIEGKNSKPFGKHYNQRPSVHTEVSNSFHRQQKSNKTDCFISHRRRLEKPDLGTKEQIASVTGLSIERVQELEADLSRSTR